MHIMDNLQINVLCTYFHLIQYNWIHTDFYLTQLVTKQSCHLKVIFFLVSGVQKIFELNYDLNVKKIKSKQTQIISMLKNIKIFFSTTLSKDQCFHSKKKLCYSNTLKLINIFNVPSTYHQILWLLIYDRKL